MLKPPNQSSIDNDDFTAPVPQVRGFSVVGLLEHAPEEGELRKSLIRTADHRPHSRRQSAASKLRVQGLADVPGKAVAATGASRGGGGVAPVDTLRSLQSDR